MSLPLKPIYLLADSQLLFWRKDGGLFLDSARSLIERESPKAAYVGASNDDRPEYYGVFESAMEGVGIVDCRMIPASPTDEDLSYMDEADLILLAGGDAGKGWRAFLQSGLTGLIVKKYYEGALLMGVSAGAAQLGLLSWDEEGPSADGLINSFGLAPFVVGAHEERQGWKSLRKALEVADRDLTGIGIPTGGGMVYHADQTLEPVRHPLHEFSMKEGRLTQNVILPTAGGEEIQEGAFSDFKT